MKEIVQLHAIFKGNVQGVFFRQQVKIIAEELKITGYVKNLEDGSVEIVAIGDRKTLETFLEKIEKKPGHGSIASFQKKYSKIMDSFNCFEIVY